MYNKCNYIVLIICSILITTLFSALQKQSPLQLPYIEEYKLDNGMRILISPNYDYPTVYCHLYINSGIVDDTLYGGTLAKSTFWDMFDGTTKYPTGKQIREKIREFGDDGGRFNTRGMSYNKCEIGNYFLKEDIKPAIELYAEVFEQLGALDKLEGFASHYGADFYGLPRNTTTMTLVKESWTVPEQVTLADGTDMVPFFAGQTLQWKLEKAFQA